MVGKVKYMCVYTEKKARRHETIERLSLGLGIFFKPVFSKF